MVLGGVASRGLREVAETEPHVALASSNGLDHQGDFVHFTTEGYVKLGERYAAQWMLLNAAQQR